MREFAAQLILALAVGVIAHAQFSSNLQGVVLDETGAVIPQASVTLLDLDTGLEQTVETSSTSVYRFSSLRPGSYEVTAEATRFQPQTLAARLQTAQTAGVNITLAVAGTEQRVVVTAEALALDTSESRIQATIQNEELQDLPFKGRNFLALAPLLLASPASWREASRKRLPARARPGTTFRQPKSST